MLRYSDKMQVLLINFVTVVVMMSNAIMEHFGLKSKYGSTHLELLVLIFSLPIYHQESIPISRQVIHDMLYRIFRFYLPMENDDTSYAHQ